MTSIIEPPTINEIECQYSKSIYIPTYLCNARRIIHQGGQSSGKTVNILMVLAKQAQENKSKSLIGKNEIITVAGISVPHLRGGALRDFEMFVYPAFAPFISAYNKTTLTYTFNNGAIIEFKTYENELKASGQKRTRLFINEANSFNYMVYWQLDSRTDIQTIVDYNPSAKFWAHDHLIGAPENELFISDHRHNPFLSESKHKQIESEKDPELFRVYARGKTGNVHGIIYPNWTIINDEDFPKNNDSYFYGIDFGYENDPTVLVQMTKIANSIYIKELAYQTGDIPPRHIVQLLKSAGYNQEQILYCEHDPDQIRQLRQLDIRAVAARKGQGSVNPGIQKVKEYNVFYTHSSTNIKEELKRYIWIEDKISGKHTNVPKPGWDHAMDAIRYGIYSHFFRNREQ